MDLESIAPYGALAVGVLCSVLYIVRVLGSQVNAELLRGAVDKMIAGGRPRRALKLTMAAPNSAVCRAVGAALLECLARKSLDAGAGDYRSLPADRLPDAILARVRVKYDEAFDAAMRPVVVASWFALLAVPSFAAAMATPWIFVGMPPIVAILASLGLALLALAARSHWRTVRARDTVFDALSARWVEISLSPNTEDADAPAPSLAEKHLPDRASLSLDVYEPGRERRLVQCEEDIIKIGALPTAHVRLEANGVSRLHAVIERTAAGADIIDLGASSPTRVNGEKIAKRTLADGDVISIGDAELRVILEMPGAVRVG